MMNESKFNRYLADTQSLEAVQSAADLPTELAASGSPTLSYRGIRLHSARDPRGEADELLHSSIADLENALNQNNAGRVSCVILGPGLGYLMDSLIRWAAARGQLDRIQIIGVEEESAIARKALDLEVWSAQQCAVRWIVGCETFVSLKRSLDLSNIVFIEIGGSFRLHRTQYESLRHASRTASMPERPLRILVPTPLYGGSYPIAGHCADAFEQLGHRVERLDLSDYYRVFTDCEKLTRDGRHSRSLQGLLTTFLAEVIAARALDWNADLVWAVAQTPLTPTALEELRHEGIHTAFWFVEDYTVFPYWRELTPHFDAVFTIQRGEFHKELDQLGVRNVEYLPCAANPAVHRPQALSAEERARYGSKVSFVGAGYYNRRNLFARLALPDFKIWGNDWTENSSVAAMVQENGRRVATDETAKIYAASQINLNLHSSPIHAAINPNGDYVNPRTFEIAACGGFQIVDNRNELSAMFAADEIVTVEKAGDIEPIVKYYLEHGEERERIASKAKDRVLNEHTYKHRMQHALTFLESRFPRLAARKRGPGYVASIKRAVADDEEMQTFLSAFDENSEVTLDDIVARIQVGHGRLTRPEGLFLLMKEFRDWGREKGVIQ